MVVITNNMTDAFDLNYLFINQLAFTFNKYISSSSSNIPKSSISNTAKQCLDYMKQYEIIHPIAETLIDYLSKEDRLQSDYSTQWIESTRLMNNSYLEQVREEIKQVLETSMQSLHTNEAEKLFSKIRRAIAITIVRTSYEVGLSLLNNYVAVVDISTQPKTKEQLVSNSYVEYLFYQYVLHIFSLIWFPSYDNEFHRYNLSQRQFPGKYETKTNVTSNSFKTLDQIYSKALNYYQKNELLFGQYDNETRYFWAIKLFNLSLLFKQFKLCEFYDQFIGFFLIEKEPLNFLVDDLQMLLSNLLVIFGITTIFLKPFNELTLMKLDKDDALIDLFTDVPESLEFQLYNSVMIPLAKCQFKQVIVQLQNETFVAELAAQLEYNLPVAFRNASGTNSSSLINYMASIIDYKNFFVILTSSRQISRLQMLELMGHDTTDDRSATKLTNDLIGVIVALDLQKYGIYYDANNQMFVNNETTKDSNADDVAKLQENIDDLKNELRAESLATKMTALLLDKYYR